MKHSKQTLEKCEKIIKAKIKTTEDSLAELRSLMNSTNAAHAHSETWDVDNASADTDTEILLSQIERTSEFLRKLHNALFRCNNGTYGICKTTGQLIPAERLFVHPCATEIVFVKQTQMCG